MRLLHSLVEASFAKPQIMYHGTSSVLARSILKHGMMPNPPAKVWDKDDQASVYTQSRASLDGSYWTTNLGTATSSVQQATQKFRSTEDWRETPGLIVIAEIIEQSALADEDSISFDIMNAWSLMMRNLFHVIAEAVQYPLGVYYGHDPKWADLRRQMVEEFCTNLHDSMKTTPRQPMPAALLKQTLVGEMHRLWAHAIGQDSPMRWAIRYNIDSDSLPSFPHMDQAEQNMARCKDALTRYYRKTAFKSHGDFIHTLRIDKPVGFSGSNRIIAMVQYDQLNKHKEPMTLLYGKTAPEDFIEQWRQRRGPFPGLNRRDGAVLIAPDRKTKTNEDVAMAALIPNKGWFNTKTRQYIPVRTLHYADVLLQPAEYGVQDDPTIQEFIEQIDHLSRSQIIDFSYHPAVYAKIKRVMFDRDWSRVNGTHETMVIDAKDPRELRDTALFLIDHGLPVFTLNYTLGQSPTADYMDERKLKIFLRTGRI